MAVGNSISFRFGETPVEWDYYTDGKDTVIAQVSARVDRGLIVLGVGSSRKSAEDEWDEQIGAKFALGRALEDLGRQLQKHAWRVVQA